MIDAAAGELAAIKAVFPKAAVRICYFHVLQAVQRWSRAGKNAVPGTGLKISEVIVVYALILFVLSRR